MSYKIQKNYINLKIERLASFLGKNKDDSFIDLSLALALDMDENNIDDDMIIDGGGDKQIDAYYIETKGLQKILHLFQVKKTNGFSSNRIIQIGNGLHWIFEADENDIRRLGNLKFKEMVMNIREEWDAKLKVFVYYCTLGDENAVKGEINEQIKVLNDKYKPYFMNNFNFHLVGTKTLYDLIIQREHINKVEKEKIRYEYFSDKGNVIDQHIPNFKGIICTVKGNEIARLVKTHGDNLFDRNIRKFLGNNKVNKSILKTCTEKRESDFFWFYNNGITLVCDSFDAVRNPADPHIDIKNAQIVNGCQTATTLFSAAEDKKLDDKAKVLVKIYSTKDNNFVDKITEATNNQNAINLRDLKANDELQILIEKYLKDKYALYYERKRNQYAKQTKLKKQHVVNNEKVAQAFLSIGKKRPSVAKTSKSRLFNEEYYGDIFANPVERLLITYKISEFCEKKKKMKVKDQMKYGISVYGYLHLARMIAYYLFGNSEEFPNNLEVDKLLTKIKKDENFLESYYKKAFQLLYRKVKAKEKKKEISSLNNFFKTNGAENIVTRILH